MFLFIGASVLPIISGTQNQRLLNNTESQLNSHSRGQIDKHPQATQKTTDAKGTQHAKENTKVKTAKTDASNSKERHVPTLPTFVSGTTPRRPSSPSPRPLDGEPVHNINTNENFSTIQLAIDAEDTLNGHTLVLDPEIYQENVVVYKSLTIRANDSESIPVIDGMGAVCFNITANSVTLKWLNMTNATNAINCSGSGITLLNNTFYYDSNGLVWVIHDVNLTSSKSILASTIRYNTFYSNSSVVNQDMVYIQLDLMYLYTSAFTVSIGAITVNQNTFFINETTDTDAIDFDEIYVEKLNGGTITIGKINISGNTIYGGDEGLDFYGEIYHMKNVAVTIGDINVMNNVMKNQTGEGVNIDYFDAEDWFGTTHGTFGKLLITQNNVQSTNGADGIDVSDYGYWYNYTDTASLHVGDMTIQDNTIDVTDSGIYFDMEEIGDYEPLYDHSSITLGDFTITDNTVTSYADDGIDIYIDDVAYDMYDYATFTMGDFLCNDNTITTQNQQMTDNITSTVHLARNYYAGLYNAVTESQYIYNYSPENTEWSYVFTSPQPDPTVLYYTDWREAVNTTPPNMVGKVIYMHIISEDRYFQMNFTSWTQEGGGGFSYTRFEVVDGEVGEGVDFSRPNLPEGGDGIYVEDIDYIGYDLHNSTSCTLGDFQFNGNTINSWGDGIDVSDIEDIGEEISDSSTFTMGDIQFNENTINSVDSDGIYLDDIEYFGYDMYDDAHFTMGDIESVNNTIYAGNGYGLYVYIYEIGYDMYDDSVCHVGDMLFNYNDINSTNDNGLYFDYINEIGTDLYDNAEFTMGDIQANYNTIIAGDGYGIYIEWYEFGEYMGSDEADAVSFTMGDMSCCYNNITSYDEGIYTEDIDDIGYDMYGSSTCTIGDILFNYNTINSTDSSGLYLYDPERFGYDVYDDSQFTMGSLEANNNTIIAGDGNGIYIYYDEFGYYLGDEESSDHCVFTMGDITCNDNTITNTGGEGIYVEYLYYIGYDMYGSSTCTIGNIEFNRNWINTSDDIGMYFDDVYDFGYYMYDETQFTMGHFQVNDNVIMSYDDGIYVYYITDFGEELYGQASFVMGDLTFNNNTITSEDGCGMNIGDYEEGIYYFGDDMYGSSTFEMGDVQITENNITSYDDGIYITYLSDFGEDLSDDSVFVMGSVLINDNLIVSESDGLYIGGETYEFYGGLNWFGYDLYENASATMDNVEINDNNITSDGLGIYLDASDYGYYMEEDSMFTMGDFQVNNNLINATDDYGLYIDWLGDFGEELYDNAQATFGSIEFNNNYLNDGWGDGIDFWLGDFGYDLNDNAIVTVQQITMVNNTVISSDDGITDEWSGEFGYDITEDAVYHGRGLIVAYNTIDVANDGIRILDGTDNLMVGANTIQNAGQGVHIKEGSYNVTVAYNTMDGTENDGIYVQDSFFNIILANMINGSQNASGVELSNSNNNTILRNDVSFNNDTGINLTTSWNNSIYHNNILNNTLQGYDDSEAGNTWDNGYPSGGNYWSDYEGIDAFRGPNQDVPGTDGIGDTPYNITGFTPNDQDRYPFTDRVVINHPSLYTPNSPSPSNGAEGVSTHATLSWKGGDPDQDFINYDVYFGTTNPPTYVYTIYLSNETIQHFNPGILASDHTYYWKIVAWDTFDDTASGPVWSFYTGVTSNPSAPPGGPSYDHFPPTADAGGPYSGIVNTPISFDGSGSSIHYINGSITKYEWKFFGDDTWHDLGSKPTHTYSSVGTYFVSLRVTDTSGYQGINSTSATITTTNSPPGTPRISGPESGQLNTVYTYSITSTDPDGNNVHFLIDWGDGTTMTSPVVGSGDAYEVSHSWTTAGVHTITVTAKDTYEASSGAGTLAVAISAKAIPGEGQLIDSNGDGIYDSFVDTNGHSSNVQIQPNGTYLVDLNGDGVWDHSYNPASGTFTAYTPGAAGGGPDLLLWGGLLLIIIIILFLIFFIVFRRRRKKDDDEKK
jgi:parallel beta-helix repeat protein